MPYHVRFATIVTIVFFALLLGCWAVFNCQAEENYIYFVPEAMVGYGMGGILLFTMDEVVEYCNTPPISYDCSAIRFNGDDSRESPG